jgi:hypothetical protein
LEKSNDQPSESDDDIARRRTGIVLHESAGCDEKVGPRRFDEGRERCRHMEVVTKLRWRGDRSD